MELKRVDLATGSAPTFDYVEKLVAIGLPLDKVAWTFTQLTAHHVASVQAGHRRGVSKVATEEAAKLAHATPPPKAFC